MAIDVKLKRSHTHSTIPTTSNLVEGEVAFNTHDRKMYMRDGSSNVVTISDHYATAFESSAQTLYVTVATSAAAHPYHGTGSSNKYKINGVFSPFLKLIPKNTYKFDQSDSSNSSHPLRFYLDAAKTTAYTTGVTNSGTPGSSGAYTQIVVAEDAPSVLYYQCSAHGYMGWAASTSTTNALTPTSGLDTDATVEFGKVHLGNQGYADFAGFSHIDQNGTATYSLLHSNVGSTYVNASTGQFIYLRNNNSDIAAIASTGIYIYPNKNIVFEGATADTNETTLTVTDPTADRTITFPDATGTVITTGNADAGATTTSSSDADHVLINDGGVLKKITPANLGIGAGGASLAFKTIAVSGQSDVVADSSTDTLTFVAGSNITLTTNASNDSVTIASSASGSAITIKDEGSALSTAASSINFVGAGVTASGTGVDKTVTISGTSTTNNTIRETFTGNGSATAFTLSNNFTTNGAVVFYNGQHLTPTTDYSISGSTLTFTFAPVNSSEIVVRNLGEGQIQIDKFTANGSTTAFTLTNIYSVIDEFMVFSNGSLLVPSTDYTFTSPRTVTFQYTPANNDEIIIRGTGKPSNLASPTRFNYVATSNQTVFTGADAASQTLSFTGDNLEVFLNGSKLNKQQGDFTVSGGNTVTLASGASSSDIVEILVFSQYAVANALASGSNLSDVANATTALNNLGGASTGKAIAMSIVFGG